MKDYMQKAKLVFLCILTVSFLGCDDDDDENLPAVVAGFTFVQNEATGTVAFTNTSEDAQSFLWDFGNGETSTDTNPVITFEDGTFTVTLEASNIAGSSDIFEEEITVLIPEVDPELLINGDFEAGIEPWFGSGANLVTEGGNSFNQVDVEVVGNSFDVNLSQVVEIVQGTNYILTFDASASVARTMLAGIGLNVDPFTNTAPEVNLTTDTQTFTLQLAANDFGGADSRVLFDMGAAVGTVIIDNVSLVEGGDGSDTNGGTSDTNLLVNGDFEAGVDPWIGNAANVVTEGGNSFNQADVTAAGNPFDVNLSQVLTLTQGTNYILTFDASASVARTMLAGIGLNVDPFTNTAPEVNLTTDTQTFTLQLAANDFGGADSRVLFDMGAAVGTVIIDNVSLVEGGDGSDTNGGTSDTNLLVNGDFEAGVDPWIGNAANVVTEGGNSFNQADVTAAGNPFDVNLSQVLTLTQGTNYILTFDASASVARTMLAGIGLNVDPFTNTAPEVNLTTDTQTFTLQLAANDFGGADSRVLFDMGAAVGTVIIDNVSLVEGGDGSDTNGGTSDSNLLVNGDFEAGVDPWIGNAANVVTEGGNSFNQADVTAAGNPFDVNLSQVVEIVQGTNYILTFDASASMGRTMLAGIGLNEDPFTNTAPSIDLTTETQTFMLQLAANDFGSVNSRILFDMGADIGTVIIDNVSLVEGGDGSDTNGGTPDSNLLVNGDFEAGIEPWFGNAANVMTDGGNSFNFADVQTAGDAFAVNLSQVVEITQGTNYILTFDASSNQARTMLAGIGLNVDPFTSTAPEVNLTIETQTFTLQLAATEFGGADSRVLFDMGADVGTVVIDNVSLVVGGDGSDTN